MHHLAEDPPAYPQRPARGSLISSQGFDRWQVFKSPAGKYVAGPVGVGIMADFARKKRWIDFPVWQDAQNYAQERASGQ